MSQFEPKGTPSENQDWFYYNSYWRTWSRVLLRMGGQFHTQVEIDLTPINNENSEWEHIKKFNVREHRTPTARGDIWTHYLPDEVLTRLHKRLSLKQIHILLHADVFKLIDQDVLKAASTSLCLTKVCKPELKPELLALLDK